jgi:hypothetical protein
MLTRTDPAGNRLPIDPAPISRMTFFMVFFNFLVSRMYEKGLLLFLMMRKPGPMK